MTSGMSGVPSPEPYESPRDTMRMSRIRIDCGYAVADPAGSVTVSTTE